MFWTMNTILCIDFPIHSVEFEECVMKLYQCWDFLCSVVRSILAEQADKTPRKLCYDQKKKKSLKTKIYALGGNSLFSSALLFWNMCGVVILALGT